MEKETKLQFLSNYRGPACADLHRALNALSDAASPINTAAQEIAGQQHNGRDVLEVFASFVQDVVADGEYKAPLGNVGEPQAARTMNENAPALRLQMMAAKTPGGVDVCWSDGRPFLTHVPMETAILVINTHKGYADAVKIAQETACMSGACTCDARRGILADHAEGCLVTRARAVLSGNPPPADPVREALVKALEGAQTMYRDLLNGYQVRDLHKTPAAMDQEIAAAIAKASGGAA